MLNFSLSKKTKIIFSIVVFVFCFALLFRETRSEDFTVVCDNSGCTSPTISIFNESGVLPGDSFERTLAVENNRSRDITVKLSAGKKSETDDIFLDVLNVVIRNADDNLIGSLSLADFLDGEEFDLGNITSSSRKSIKIAIDFDQNAGNLYQNKKAVFDIYFDISGDDVEESPTPTPTAFPTPCLPPMNCNFPTTPPLPSIPTPPLPPLVSRVLGLSNPIKRLAGMVLGDSTEAEVYTQDASSYVDDKNNTCEDKYYLWWLPLLIQLLILGLISIIGKKNNLLLKYLLLFGLIIGVLSQLAHELSKCNCSTGIWCPRYIFINLLITGLFSFFNFLLAKKSLNKLEETSINN